MNAIANFRKRRHGILAEKASDGFMRRLSIASGFVVCMMLPIKSEKTIAQFQFIETSG
jgi:hypothetical protein